MKRSCLQFKNRRFSSISALLSLAVAGSFGISQNANAVPSDEKANGTESVVPVSWPAGFRSMTPAESVGANLIRKYRSDSSFNGVFVDGPNLVRLAMKAGKATVPQVMDGVTIVVEPTEFSFDELLQAARRLDQRNPQSYGTHRGSDGSSLMIVPISQINSSGLYVG